MQPILIAINTKGCKTNDTEELNVVRISVLSIGYKQTPATPQTPKLNNTNNKTNVIVANNLPVIIFQRLNGLMARSLIVPLSYSDAIKLAAIKIAKIVIISRTHHIYRLDRTLLGCNDHGAVYRSNMDARPQVCRAVVGMVSGGYDNRRALYL